MLGIGHTMNKRTISSSTRSCSFALWLLLSKQIYTVQKILVMGDRGSEGGSFCVAPEKRKT